MYLFALQKKFLCLVFLVSLFWGTQTALAKIDTAKFNATTTLETGETWVVVSGTVTGTDPSIAAGALVTIFIGNPNEDTATNDIAKATTLTASKQFSVKVGGLKKQTGYEMEVYLGTVDPVNHFATKATSFTTPILLTGGPSGLGSSHQDAPGEYSLLTPLPYAGSSDGNDALINSGNAQNGYLVKIDQNFKISDFVKVAMRILIGIAGILAVVMIIVVGVQLMTTDSFSEKSMAKERMMDIIGGLLLALCSVILLGQINPDLLEIRFGNMKKVSVAGVDEGEWMKLVNSGQPLTGGGGAIPAADITPTGSDTGNDITDCKNPNQFDAFFKASAAKYGVSCTLLKATMCRESHGDPNVVSGAGAIGLMQIMPNTGKGLGFSTADLKIPEKAIDAAAKLNKQLRTSACNGKASNAVCNASEDKYVLASYNGGTKANEQSTKCATPPQTAWQCTQNDGYKETRHYVNRIANNVAYLKQQNMGCD